MSAARTTVVGPALALQTCARRLSPFGVDASSDGASGLVLDWGDRADLDPPPQAAVSWHGPAQLPEEPACEVTIQARCGLMHLHGADDGEPRRLGLEVASVTAGLLAAQGLLAAHIGRLRGRAVTRVETSVLEAGLLLVSHYVAAATCAEPWEPAPPAPAPGPPFISADGRWFEIETLDPEAWKNFWSELGAAPGDLGRAWASFRARYYRPTCTLAPGLHEATARHPLAAVEAVAQRHEVSLSPLRAYDDVLVDPGIGSDWPVIEPFAANAETTSRRGGTGTGNGTLPLAGLRVVEATSRLQGPLAGVLLGMLGAEVVKVEPPGGDFGRIVPPVAGTTGSFFGCFNRGKQTVELDLTTSTGRASLIELVAEADAFLHNWRPGKASQWALDAADLAPVNPGLVHACASGWGERPKPLVGTDFLVQAHAGLGNGLRPVGDDPRPSRIILVDYLGALLTCEGILGGLCLRHQLGRGCAVRSSLLGGAMALQAHVLDDLATHQECGRRHGRPLWGPLARPIPTSDGYLALSVADEAAFASLVRLCGIDGRSRSGEVAEADVARRLSSQPAQSWLAGLEAAGIAGAALPVDLDLASLPADPRLVGLFEVLAGPARAPRSPWRFHW